MEDARVKPPEAFVKELRWGLTQESWPAPHLKPVCSLIMINEDLFASSDGLTLAFWSRRDVIWTIDLPVVAMAYLPRLNQVVACVKNSKQLHFVYLHFPYTIRVHPLHFTDREVTSMEFYEGTSTLVCTGQGVMFTRVVVPAYFKDTEPVPETLQFERIGEFYRDERFDSGGVPFIVRSPSVVIVCLANKLFVHMPNGVLVQQLSRLDIDGSISCVSYNQSGNCLVIGDDTGCLSVLKFITPNPFVPGAAPDAGRIVKKLKMSEDKMIVGEIIDRNFLVGVDYGHKFYIYSLKDENCITTGLCPIPAVTGWMMGNYLVLFSSLAMVCYDCSIFTKHWTDMDFNALRLQRCQSASKPAKIIAYLTNRSVNAFSPKFGTQLWGFMSSTSARDIQSFGFTRDALIDGKKYELIQADDVGFASLDQGYFAIFNFDQKNSVNQPYSNAFLSTMPGFDIGWVPTEVIKLQVLDRFMSVFRIETREYPKCICGVLQNGNCVVFSITEKKYIGMFSCELTNVICATFSFSNKLLIVSALNKLQTFDISTKKVVQSMDSCVFTSLLLIDKDTLICGAANGGVEVRSLRTFRLLGNSKTFNTFHTDHGHRFPLDSYYQDTRSLYDVPFAVKALDYCQCRDVILSLSVSGEIFVWNKTAFPLVHIDCPFKVSAACFLNGEGTILISAFKGLFSIAWNLMFEKQFLPVSTIFDDFDLREGNAKDTKSRPAVIRRPDSSLSVDNESVKSHSEDDDEGSTCIDDFTDLIVDLDPLPKRHWAPLRPNEIEEEPKVIKRAPDLDEVMKRSQPKETKKDFDFDFIIHQKKTSKGKSAAAKIPKQKKKKAPKAPPGEPTRRARQSAQKKFSKTTPVKSIPITPSEDKPDFAKSSADPLHAGTETGIDSSHTFSFNTDKTDTFSFNTNKADAFSFNTDKTDTFSFNTDKADAFSFNTDKTDTEAKEKGSELSEQSDFNFDFNRKLGKAAFSQSSPHWKSGLKPGLDISMAMTNYQFGTTQDGTVSARVASTTTTASDFLASSEQSTSITASPREPEPVLHVDSFFQTESPVQLTSSTVREPPEPKSTTQPRHTRGRAVMARREDRVVTIDDAMFTNYRIDGFKRPFGGFVFQSGEQPVLARSANAPVIRVKTLPRTSRRAKAPPKPAIVQPPSYTVYYSRMNNTC